MKNITKSVNLSIPISLIDSNSSIETHFLIGQRGEEGGNMLDWKSVGRENVGVQGTETECLEVGVLGDSGTIPSTSVLGDDCGDDCGESPVDLGDLGDPACII